MELGETKRSSIAVGQTYNYSVNITSEVNMTNSSFVFQVHAERFNLTLTNASNCSGHRECTTTGTRLIGTGYSRDRVNRDIAM